MEISTLRDLLQQLGAQLDPCGRIGFYEDSEILDKKVVVKHYNHATKYVIEKSGINENITFIIKDEIWK